MFEGTSNKNIPKAEGCLRPLCIWLAIDGQKVKSVNRQSKNKTSQVLKQPCQLNMYVFTFPRTWKSEVSMKFLEVSKQLERSLSDWYVWKILNVSDHWSSTKSMSIYCYNNRVNGLMTSPSTWARRESFPRHDIWCSSNRSAHFSLSGSWRSSTGWDRILKPWHLGTKSILPITKTMAFEFIVFLKYRTSGVEIRRF